jgi:tetratricopeptide (TPR) repeat protein
MRRAELYEKTDKLDEALEDYTKALEIDPSLHAARAACMVIFNFVAFLLDKLCALICT